MRTTQAAVFDGPGKPLRVTELQITDPGPGEVLVRVVASGVCRSDYHVAVGEWSSPSPLVLGHEGAGVVETVGDGVEHVAPGNHVVLSWMPYCRKCRFCLAGRPNLCEAAEQTAYQSVLLDGTTRLRDRGFPVYSYLATASLSNYTVVPETSVIPIRPDAPLHTAALVGCAVATGIGAVLNTAQLRAGRSTLVIGCGGVGLSVVTGAALAAASPVIAVDRSAAALALARSFGATHTINATTTDVLTAIREITAGTGVEYAFEAIGLSQTIELAYQATGPAGTTTVVGQVAEGSTISIDPFELSDREKRLIGSNYGSCRPPQDFPQLINWATDRKIDLEQLVTRSIPLEKINTAFEAMGRGDAGRTVVLFD